MKIAYNGSIFFTQKYGGISRYFCSIINEYINDKKTIKVFSPIFKNNYLLNLPRKNIHGFYLPRYPTPNFFKSMVDYTSCYQIKNSEFDIVHDTYYSPSMLTLKNKKKVLTVYDLIHEKFDKLYKDNNLEFKKKIIKEADAIICISENTKRDLMEYYGTKEKKIHVSYLGWEHIPKNSTSNFVEAFNIPKNFIFFVGSRYRYKNFDLFLNSYCMSKKIKKDFDIICFGGEKFSKKEKETFKEFGIEKKILHFYGNDDLLQYLYTTARLFIFPSQYEGFGIPLLEAMSVCCPVLASDTNIFKEICKNGIHYFKNNDQHDLTERLEFLLYSDSNLSSKKDLALSICDKYSWKKCAKETYEVYKKL